jgi:hypothetical protein
VLFKVYPVQSYSSLLHAAHTEDFKTLLTPWIMETQDYYQNQQTFSLNISQIKPMHTAANAGNSSGVIARRMLRPSSNLVAGQKQKGQVDAKLSLKGNWNK